MKVRLLCLHLLPEHTPRFAGPVPSRFPKVPGPTSTPIETKSRGIALDCALTLLLRDSDVRRAGRIPRRDAVGMDHDTESVSVRFQEDCRSEGGVWGPRRARITGSASDSPKIAAIRTLPRIAAAFTSELPVDGTRDRSERVPDSLLISGRRLISTARCPPQAASFFCDPSGSTNRASYPSPGLHAESAA